MDNCKFIFGEVCYYMYKYVCLKFYIIGVEMEEENIDKYEKYMYNRCWMGWLCWMCVSYLFWLFFVLWVSIKESVL